MEGGYGKVARSIECLYEGALVVGTNKLLKWEMAKNMMREKSDFTKVKMNYSIVAPRMYDGKIESVVSRIMSFADMIQLTHLKLQQVMSRMVPDGVFIDMDGLLHVALAMVCMRILSTLEKSLVIYDIWTKSESGPSAPTSLPLQ